MPMRLQKYLALCGVASRRASEELIARGRVEVNGKVVSQMGVQVEQGDEVKVDGRPLQIETRDITVLYYKPEGVVSTASDERGRPTVVDAVRSLGVRLYPVGRLDINTEGLLLLTNNGELALRMTHPRYGMEKVYVVTLRKALPAEALKTLREGVLLEDGLTAPARVNRLAPSASGAERIEIRIHEGRNRQVRRMMEAVGNTVVHLVRVAEGPLTLEGLRPGQWRILRPEEVEGLKKALQEKKTATRAQAPVRARTPKPARWVRPPRAQSHTARPQQRMRPAAQTQTTRSPNARPPKPIKKVGKKVEKNDIR
nr:pseudouridine synthase [Maliibacterium massiliense]